MSRIAFAADVHLGNHKRFGGLVSSSMNDRCRLGLGVLEAAVREAFEKRRCRALVVLGDLFDYQRPEAPLIAAVQRICKIARQHDGEVIVLVGNHDQTSDAPDDHALAPLAPVARVIDRPTVVNFRHGVDVELVLVPFFTLDDGGYAAQALQAAVQAATFSRQPQQSIHRLLGVHLGVSDESTAPWLRGARDSIDAANLGAVAHLSGCSAALAGNWHDRRSWRLLQPASVDVLQLGALVPTGWDNPGLDGYGTLAVWDSEAADKLGFVELPGPRFLTAAPGEIERVAAAARALGHTPFIKTVAPVDGLAAARAELAKAGVIGEVVPDVTEAQIAARSAAQAARSADTLDEAVAAFVAEMPLSENVDRGRVLSAVREYMTSARRGV